MFSLFSAPMGFVLYSVFLLVISLPGPKARSVSCCDHTKLILNILTAAAAAILVYAGYLRSGYVFLFFAITTFLVYYCVYPGRRLFRYLPIAYLAAGILFVAGLSARVPDALLINTAKNIYLTAYGGGKIRAAAVSGTKQPGCDNFKFFNLPDVHKNLTPAAAPISAPVSIPAPPSPLSHRPQILRIRTVFTNVITPGWCADQAHRCQVSAHSKGSTADIAGYRILGASGRPEQ